MWGQGEPRFSGFSPAESWAKKRVRLDIPKDREQRANAVLKTSIRRDRRRKKMLVLHQKGRKKKLREKAQNAGDRDGGKRKDRLSRPFDRKERSVRRKDSRELSKHKGKEGSCPENNFPEGPGTSKRGTKALKTQM